MARKVERLTALGVKSLAAPGMYPDGGGLYLNVAAGGTKSWILRFRLNGKRRDMGLGPYPTITLGDARERANQHRRDLADKVDPLSKRNAEREAARAQMRAEAKAKERTFRAVADACILDKRDGWRAGGGQERLWRQSLKDHVFAHPLGNKKQPNQPKFGDQSISAIDLEMVANVLKPIWLDHNSMAQKIRGRIEAILDYATAKNWRTGDNPARTTGPLPHLLPKANPKVKHHPALPYAELRPFLADLENSGWPLASKGLRFTILTATRTDEVLSATWGEFDLERAVWVIPAERMKMGQDHVVPLSAAALAILSALPRGGDNDRPFKMGERTMYYLTKTLRVGITVHGFRSTFRDWAYEENEFPNEIVEHCLAHIEGSASEKAYKRGGAVERRRRVMDAWAAFCCGEEPAANVIELQAAAG